MAAHSLLDQIDLERIKEAIIKAIPDGTKKLLVIRALRELADEFEKLNRGKKNE